MYIFVRLILTIMYSVSTKGKVACLALKDTARKQYSVEIVVKSTAQKGQGDKGKRTSDRAQTRDLHSITEFQPREPPISVKILRFQNNILLTDNSC